MSDDSTDWTKILTAAAALVAALGGVLVGLRGGGDDPVPAVIIIRGSTLPEDDGLSDSERDREWLLDQRTADE